MISELFNTILYQPLLNLLILFYVYIPGGDFGIAVIALTLLIKIILLPVSLKATHSQRKLSLLQPKIKQIQKKYEKDKAKQSEELMNLYKNEKINPFSGCLPFIIQLPFLIALYKVFLSGLNIERIRPLLYGFVPPISSINPVFLGFINLNSPNAPLAFLAAVLQFLQTKSISLKTTKKHSKESFFQKQTLYFFPLLTFFLVWKFGAVIGIYWITTTLFSLGEYYIIKSKEKTSLTAD